MPARSRAGRIAVAAGLEPVLRRVLAARLVRESAAFLARDLRGQGSYTYRVRGTDGARVVVEHGTPDVATLAELWHAQVYAPPPAANAALLALGPSPSVLDLGANVGMFAVWCAAGLLDKPHVVAVEPDARNAEVLRRVLALDAELFAGVEVVEAAATTADGSVGFADGGFTESRLDPSATTTVPGIDVLDGLMTRCDVLKIDIEGGEWDLLADRRFAECSARVVAVEPHPCADAASAAAEHLERAGYATTTTVNRDDPTSACVWGVRNSAS